MEAEVPQPISNLPSRWGGLTTGQLGWLAVAGAVPLACFRLHLGLAPLVTLSAPWASIAAALGFGLRHGRRLDVYLLDAILFRLQPHRFSHPDSVAQVGGYRWVDQGPSSRGPLPWNAAPAAGTGP